MSQNFHNYCCITQKQYATMASVASGCLRLTGNTIEGHQTPSGRASSSQLAHVRTFLSPEIAFSFPGKLARINPLIRSWTEYPRMTAHRYRTAVAGAGIVYDGQSRTEAFRQFDRFVAQSKDEQSTTAAKRVAVFRGYDILREYIPPGGHWLHQA